MTRLAWGDVIARGVVIVEDITAAVGVPPTLRQVFYRLVAEQAIPNTANAYKRLSSLSAKGRRDGTFPALVDEGRTIARAASWSSPAAGVRGLARQYRRDRTEGQPWLVVLGVEKATVRPQLWQWFANYGCPIVTLRGYGSQTYVDEVREMVEDDGRPAVLLYAGDFDPSGEDIPRDFIERTDCWDAAVAVRRRPGGVLGHVRVRRYSGSREARARQPRQARPGGGVMARRVRCPECDALTPREGLDDDEGRHDPPICPRCVAWWAEAESGPDYTCADCGETRRYDLDEALRCTDCQRVSDGYEVTPQGRWAKRSEHPEMFEGADNEPEPEEESDEELERLFAAFMEYNPDLAIEALDAVHCDMGDLLAAEIKRRGSRL